jgi:ribonuclease Y
MASEEAKKLVAEAQEKQKTLLLESKEAAVNMKAEAEASYRETRGELQRLERRLSQKEENLERRDESFQRREQLLSGKEREIEKARNRVEELRQKQQQQLEQIAGLSSAEAKEILLQKVDSEVRDEASRRVRAMETAVKEESDKKSRDILSQAIQRLAGDVVAESTVSVVSLPGDEMKGRLIGREGRNIRAWSMPPEWTS